MKVQKGDNENIQTCSLRDEHIEPISKIHASAFPNFFLSFLGPSFLSQLYRGYLEDPSTISVVVVDQDESPVGAVVGTAEPAGFYSRLLRRRGLKFALAAARSALSKPSIGLRLIRAVTYRGDAPEREQGSALLASICIDPAWQGAGLGQLLLAEWERSAKERGVKSAYLTTDAENNESVNRFYRRSGWRLEQSYATKEGRKMNRFIKELS